MGFLVSSDERVQLLAPCGALAVFDETRRFTYDLQIVYRDDDEFHGQ